MTEEEQKLNKNAMVLYSITDASLTVTRYTLLNVYFTP